MNTPETLQEAIETLEKRLVILGLLRTERELRAILGIDDVKLASVEMVYLETLQFIERRGVR